MILTSMYHQSVYYTLISWENINKCIFLWTMAFRYVINVVFIIIKFFRDLGKESLSFFLYADIGISM